MCLDNLDSLLMGLSLQPEENLLQAIVEPQLRQCKELRPFLERYDSAPDGSDEKSLRYLLDSARRIVERQQRADVVTGLSKPAKAAETPFCFNLDIPTPVLYCLAKRPTSV